MKIALVAMQSLWLQLEQNYQKIEKFSLEAAKNKANIICFPELSLTGYEVQEIDESIFNKIAEYEKKIENLAEQNKITIIYGTICLKEKRQYIGQVVITPQKRKFLYLKTHPGRRERMIYSPGNELSTFALDDGTPLGIQLCSDNHYPEAMIQLAVQGAKIIFAPFAVPGDYSRRKSIWQKYLLARAYDNRVFLLATNQTGKTFGGKDFAGGVIAYNPNGEVLLENFTGKESCNYVDVDLAEYEEYHSGNLDHGKRCFVTTRRKQLYIR